MNRLLPALSARVKSISGTFRAHLAFVALAVMAQGATASTVNFDGVADQTSITTQFAGVTFSNTIVLSAGGSLNELDFPPRSGSNVAVDSGGPIQLVFDADQSFFEAYFTYAVQLTLTGYGAGGAQLITSTSQFTSNVASGGDPGSAPNERIQWSMDGLRRVVIQGDASGSSFVMDDVTFRSAATAPVPEPGTLWLAMTGAAFLFFFMRRRVAVNPASRTA